MHCLAPNSNDGTALFDVEMKFYTVYFLLNLAHCQWLCSPVTNGQVLSSPGAAILVTMCHMLCPQRLPSLARCSLCH